MYIMDILAKTNDKID